MAKRTRRSDRCGRAPLFSPGRPVVAGRDEQRRFWAAIAVGMASEDAAVQAGAMLGRGLRPDPMKCSRLMPCAPRVSRFFASNGGMKLPG
jgi:hypothetical protein